MVRPMQRTGRGGMLDHVQFGELRLVGFATCMHHSLKDLEVVAYFAGMQSM